MASADCAEIRELSRQMVRELGLVESPHPRLGVTIGQVHALLELARHDSVTVGDLGHALRIDKSVASRLMSSLESKGWISATNSHGDSRRKPFALTAAGRAKTGEIDSACGDITAAALATLSPSERAELKRALGRYVDAIRATRRRTAATIRPLRKRDEKELSRIISDVDSEFGVGRGDGEEIDFSIFHDDGAFYSVAELEGVICGGGGIVSRPEGAAGDCELRLLYLKSPVRGLGIGGRILSGCLETARRLGYRRCYAITSSRFVEAISLYERNGFKKVPAKRPSGRSSCDRLYVKEL